MTPRHLVIVEDHHDARETMRDLLELCGHRVQTAGDGPSGLDLILTARPEVALVDIGLPGLDGYQLASEVRKQNPDHGPFLVALTGYGQPEDRDRALRAGFDAHLVKPVEIAELSRLLESLHR